MRFVIFALFMVLATQVSAQEVLPGEKPDQQTAQGQPDEKAESIAPASVPADPPTEKPNDNAAEAGDREAQDHLLYGDGAAQWLMAVVAIIGTALSGWAVWLLKETLKATRDAVNEAAEGTRAAMKAAEISEKHFIADQRPWLSIQGVPKVSSYEEENTSKTISIAINVKNVGKSPAIGLTSRVNFKATKLNIENRMPIEGFCDECVSSNEWNWGNNVVLPGSSDTTHAISNDIPEIGDAKYIHAVVCVKYRTPGVETVFYTGFCMRFGAGDLVGEKSDAGATSEVIRAVRMAGCDSIG